MHLHSHHLVPILALTAWLPSACRNVGDHAVQASAPDVAAMSRPVGVPPSTAPIAIERRAEALCHARPRCAVLQRRPIAGSSNVELVDIRLAHAPDVTTDEEHCDRREYWLLQPSGEVLLATDCATQWGADNPGPAELRLDGARLTVRYVEFQSSDGCELYEASLKVSPVIEIEKQTRWQGAVRKDRCAAQGRQGIVPTDGGDGSPDHPLLVLHR